jgi:hypothetical protein
LVNTLRLPSPRRWLLLLAASAGAVILIPTTGLLLSALLGGDLPLLYAPYFFLMLAYTDAARYLALNLAVLVLIPAALIWARPNRWAAAWLAASLAAVLLYPATLGSYRPALAARPGLAMVVPTQPDSLVGSIVKRAQTSAEMRPCAYHLLGWAADGRFYYESACAATSEVWAIDPASEARPARAASAPADLAGVAVGRQQALASVEARGVRPENVEPFTRPILLVAGETLKSGDGAWLAVVSQHVYGPQDVLLIQVTD